jgi:hypothetical protein
MMAMTTPTVAASIASTRKGSWVYQRLAPTSPHDADLGAPRVRRDLDHVGNQQDSADGLNQGDRERDVAQAVQHREQPVDQLLLIQHAKHTGLALHRGVKVLVLLGIVQLDDERCGKESLPATSLYCGNLRMASS